MVVHEHMNSTAFLCLFGVFAYLVHRVTDVLTEEYIDTYNYSAKTHDVANSAAATPIKRYHDKNCIQIKSPRFGLNRSN